MIYLYDTVNCIKQTVVLTRAIGSTKHVYTLPVDTQALHRTADKQSYKTEMDGTI